MMAVNLPYFLYAQGSMVEMGQQEETKDHRQWSLNKDPAVQFDS